MEPKHIGQAPRPKDPKATSNSGKQASRAGWVISLIRQQFGRVLDTLRKDEVSIGVDAGCNMQGDM